MVDPRMTGRSKIRRSEVGRWGEESVGEPLRVSRKCGDRQGAHREEEALTISL
jgi:hypothetical protein